MKNKVAICEPHSDDAWLNLGGYLLKNPDTEFLIITVFARKGRRVFTHLLEKFGKIKTVFYGYENIEKEDFENEREIETVFLLKSGQLFEELEERIKRETKDYDLLLLPYGKLDANHNLLSRIKGNGYYREIPYYWTKNGWKNVDYKFRQFKREEKIDIGEVAKLKWRIFDTVYREKLGMFRFFRPYYKTIIDEVIFYE